MLLIVLKVNMKLNKNLKVEYFCTKSYHVYRVELTHSNVKTKRAFVVNGLFLDFDLIDGLFFFFSYFCKIPVFLLSCLSILSISLSIYMLRLSDLSILIK